MVSTKVDAASDEVEVRLREGGAEVTRIDTEDVPFEALLTTELGPGSEARVSFSPPVQPACISLSTATSLWYRRVRAPEPPAEMNPGVYDFCAREARAAVLGAVQAIAAIGVPCMSPPARVWAAEHKVLQLQVARAVGLPIPDTVVTNDPDAVIAAFARFGGEMIAKPTRTGYVDTGTEELAIYTSRVLEEHLERVEDARWSPAIYQRLVEKRCDVRVTIVGRELFVAEIDSQTDECAAVDWRRTQNPDLPHRRAALPTPLTDTLRRYMGTLGLEFGAVDLVRTPDDGYVFLEINPNGQWLWIDDCLDLGITDAVASWHLRSARA